MDDSLAEYYNQHLGYHASGNYGYLITSYGEPEDMALDGSVLMQPFSVIGNDFAGLSSFRLTSNEKDYPDDAKPKYIVYHKKLCGSVYEMATGKLQPNSVLVCAAVYGQSQWYWFLDEAALFAGPFDQKNIITSVSSKNDGKYDYDDRLTCQHWYNILICEPLPEKLNADGLYDPLASFRNMSEEIADEFGHSAYGETHVSLGAGGGNPGGTHISLGASSEEPDERVYAHGFKWIIPTACATGAALVVAAVVILLVRRRKARKAGKTEPAENDAE